MDVEHELPKVLDGVDEPVTVEELEAVVRRAGQRRRATLVAGAAALLLCGGVAGALARGPRDDRATGFAAPTAKDESSKPAVATMRPGGPTGLALTALFRRETSGVAIRAYRASWGGNVEPVDPKCALPDTIQGELSNDAAVGFAMAPALPGDTFALLGAGSFGRQENEPVTWATVRAGAGVSTVRFTLGSAADTMAPLGGIALLAAPGNSGEGFVEGLDADGKVVATQRLNELSHPTIDPSCMPPDCVVNGDGGNVGSGTVEGPPPTEAPGQDPAGAVPAVPAKPPLDQGAVPGPDPDSRPGMPFMEHDMGVMCDMMPMEPPLGIPVPGGPHDGSTGPATAPSATAPPTSNAATSTTAGAAPSTTSPNQAP